MKSVIVDTSSAILLYKSGLIPQLVSHYQTLITPSVHHELTQHGYPGSHEFQKLCDQQQICLLTDPALLTTGKEYRELPALNPGERDTILQFIQGTGDFIILDDGRAARYCKRAGLPFINALLFPRILFLIQQIPELEFHLKTDELINNGYYADTIIKLAADLPDQAIQPFLPVRCT